MRPSMMALVSTKMFPLRVALDRGDDFSKVGNRAFMSLCRRTPSKRPQNPRNRLTMTGTPQPNQPSNEYKGMEISSAANSPTNSPMVLDKTVVPEIESMNPVALRHGLTVRKGANNPPMGRPARVSANPQGKNRVSPVASSDTNAPSLQPRTANPPAPSSLSVQRLNTWSHPLLDA